MSVAKIDYHPSYSFVKDSVNLFPAMKIMSLTGYNPEKYLYRNGKYNRLNCAGECRIHYIITQYFPPLRKYTRGPWMTTSASKDNKNFNEDAVIPLAYSNLFEYNGICIVLESTRVTKDNQIKNQYMAASVMPLYNTKRIFRRGIYELELHPLPEDVTLEKIEAMIPDPAMNGKPKCISQLNRLLKMNRKQLRGELPDIPMDRKSMPEISQTIEQLKKESGQIFLSVKFCFNSKRETCAPVVLVREPRNEPVVMRHNPVDEKYIKISRNPRMADTDKSRKPNIETINKLLSIMNRPPNQDLSDPENDLIWRYRFYLAEKYPEQALPKFVMAVKWEYHEQEKQAVELMVQWARIPPENVLELLTGKFRVSVVRKFAVSKLKEAKDEDLLLYLFQLVQGLRYENFRDILSVAPVGAADTEPGLEPSSVVSRSGSVSMAVADLFEERRDLDEAGLTSLPPPSPALQSSSMNGRSGGDDVEALHLQEDLASFLINRALHNFKIANYLYWYLSLEANEETPSTVEVREMFAHVLKRLSAALKNGDINNQMWRSDLQSQTKFVKELCDMIRSVAEDPGNRRRKIELLRQKLAGPAFENVTRISHPFSFPLDPDFKVARIESESASVFKSGMKPALLPLVSPTGERYRTIFKHGDDLRQDQLVLQMINFMDSILRKENFDLKLTPYKVLSTSCKHGFVQFIDATPIAEILSSRGTIIGFMQQHAPSKVDPLGVKAEVMDNYLRSCAGYCVITYLLGVGDRHFDNLMLTAEGHFFHIDFGFILGNDPKPMPAEIRLTKQMVDAMGGTNTPQFSRFCNMTFAVFLTLRRYANLFLTLLSMVLDAGIQDIARDRSNAIKYVKDRFCLDLNDEMAVLRIASKMTESVKAIIPEMMEKIHAVVQYMRN